MGFPKCHIVGSNKGIERLVVVRSEGNWKRYERTFRNVFVDTSDDFSKGKNDYDTSEKAVGYLTVSMMSSSGLMSLEDVSESKIASLIDSIYEGIPKPSTLSKISKVRVVDNG